MKEIVGIDIADIIRADGYDAKGTRNINPSGEVKGLEGVETVAISNWENNKSYPDIMRKFSLLTRLLLLPNGMCYK